MLNYPISPDAYIGQLIPFQEDFLSFISDYHGCFPQSFDGGPGESVQTQDIFPKEGKHILRTFIYDPAIIRPT